MPVEFLTAAQPERRRLSASTVPLLPEPQIDRRLIPALRELARNLRTSAARCGVVLTVRIHCADFLLSKAAIQQRPIADLVIANGCSSSFAATDTMANY